MFYRVTANLAFRNEDEANDFYHDCELAIVKSDTINPGTPTAERGHIQIEECLHDITPPGECEIIDEEWTD